MRIANWTKLSSKELWRTWLTRFEGEEDAIVTAVFIGNRLVKDKARSTKRIFYSIKDEFLRRTQATGQRVRHEVDHCYRCDGTGNAYEEEDGVCQRCCGDGIWRDRWLYVHRFEVNGRPYCFHSYTEPAVLLTGQGEDLESYGGQFGEEELAELALPMTGLLRMLRYVAAVYWGLVFDDGRYVRPPPKKETGAVEEETAGSRPMNLRFFWVGQPTIGDILF
jgi:hypothetical protein